MIENKKVEKNKVYLAGPLFSLAERTFNHNLKRLLAPYFDVYLPQEDGGLIIHMIKAGLPPKLASQKVFDIDIRAINECDVFLIILDGRAVDEGAAFELGFAHAKDKPCYGLKTDFRQLLATGNNPMIDGPLETVFKNIEDLLEWAQSYDKRKSLIEIRGRNPKTAAKQNRSVEIERVL